MKTYRISWHTLDNTGYNGSIDVETENLIELIDTIIDSNNFMITDVQGMYHIFKVRDGMKFTVQELT